MAKNTPKGKESEEVKKLKAEDEVTAAKNAERQAQNEKEEAEKLEAAIAESEDQTPPIAVPEPLPNKELQAAWDALLKRYEAENPVKFAAKKKRGEFDKIPAGFTGRNELKLSK